MTISKRSISHGNVDHIVKAARLKAAKVAEDSSAPALTGDGAKRIHEARAIIRMIADAPPRASGVSANVLYRVETDGDMQRHRPILLRTPAALRLSEPGALARDLALAHREWISLQSSVKSATTSIMKASLNSVESRVALRATSANVAAVVGVDGGGPIPDLTHDLIDAQQAGQSIEDGLRTKAASMLDVSTGTSPLRYGPSIPNVAIHDFAEYVYIHEPNTLSSAPGVSVLPPDLQSFLSKCKDAIRSAVMANGVAEIDVDLPGHYFTIDLRPQLATLVESLYKLFLASCAAELYEFAARLDPTYDGGSGDPFADVIAAFATWCHRLTWTTAFNPNTVSSSFDDPAKWTDAGEGTITIFYSSYPEAHLLSTVGVVGEDYPFQVFAAGDVNYGLRIVYRQEWRSLGNQSGEIVRTIPLGPKQSEKISTKIVMTSKSSRTAETSTSLETSSESSNTTKDSTDVVDEASSKLGWHVDAEASGGFGPVSAKLSAGVSGDSASSSKQTKSRLNDTMSKTASRMRRDTKVIVTTETTSSTEYSTASEITNPNDEIAITYVYSRLQRQYEIYTAMAEVASVVFVPEAVPAWKDVNETWIRDNAYILRGALLDESFSEDILDFSREPITNEPPSDGDTAMDSAKAATTTLAGFSSFPGYLPDHIGSSQEALQKRLAEVRASQQARARRDYRLERLCRHFRTNILHYMRAIWSAEDSDQRMLRYRNIHVPTRWTFVPTGSTNPMAPLGEVSGQFLPDFSTDSMRRLCDVVNPAGPLGYAANMAIFQLKLSPSLVDLNDCLSMLRSSYVRFAATIDDSASTSKSRLVVVYEPRYEFATYEVTYSGGTCIGKYLPVSGAPVVLDVVAKVPHSFDIDGICVWLSKAPVDGDVFRLKIAITDELEDPELRSIGMSRPLPEDAVASAFFSESLLIDMASYLPEVAAIGATTNSWAQLSEEDRDKVRSNYHRYLFVREHTRRFVLDTNNVVLDLDIGKTPALEDFKRLHRGIDVLKELEELARRRLENLRRAQRAQSGDVSDPDVDNLIVVNGAVSSVMPVATPGPANTTGPTTTPATPHV